MNEDKIQKISEQTISRYSTRYKKLGRNVKSLGWGTIEQQQYRFHQVLGYVDCDNKTILDIGCGFGDFYLYMKSKNIKPKKYTGWDINQDLIDEANREKHNNSEFLVVNLLDQEIDVQADIVVMLGLLNYNLNNKNDNFEYSKSMIKKAFKKSKHKLVVDFLSINLSKEYPKEDFIFYHNPCDMLKFALTLTNNVSLFHNYEAIPQKEFMLILEK
jgi:SAM-dependent methyltransferase